MKHEHVTLGDPDNPRADEINRTSTMTCTHCGEKLCVKLPLRLSTWTSQAEAFITSHAECPKPPKATEGGA